MNVLTTLLGFFFCLKFFVGYVVVQLSKFCLPKKRTVLTTQDLTSCESGRASTRVCNVRIALAQICDESINHEGNPNPFGQFPLVRYRQIFLAHDHHSYVTDIHLRI